MSGGSCRTHGRALKEERQWKGRWMSPRVTLEKLAQAEDVAVRVNSCMHGLERSHISYCSLPTSATTLQRFMFVMLLRFQVAVQVVMQILNSVLVRRWLAEGSPQTGEGINAERNHAMTF
jgi:hypothetical protein